MLGVLALNSMYAQPPGPPDRIKHVSGKFEKELKLSATQTEKLAAAYRDFFMGMDKLREPGEKPPPPPPPPPPKDKEAVERLSKTRDAAIKLALTPAQYQKYISIEKTMRPPARGARPEAPPTKEK